MSGPKREKFSTKVNSEILSAIRALAKREGRQLQGIVDEAFTNLLEKRKEIESRQNVMAAYESSHNRFSTFYKKLAE